MADIGLKQKVNFLLSTISERQNEKRKIEKLIEWMNIMEQAGYDIDTLKYEAKIGKEYLALENLLKKVELTKNVVLSDYQQTRKWQILYNVGSNGSYTKYNRIKGLTHRPNFEQYFSSIMFKDGLNITIGDNINVSFSRKDATDGSVDVKVFDKNKQELGKLTYIPLVFKTIVRNIYPLRCNVWIKFTQKSVDTINLQLWSHVLKLSDGLDYTFKIVTLDIKGTLKGLDYYQSAATNYEWIKTGVPDYRALCFLENYQYLIETIRNNERALAKKLSKSVAKGNLANAGLTALMTVQELNKDTIVRRSRDYILTKSLTINVGIPSKKGVFNDGGWPKLPDFSYNENVLVYGTNFNSSYYDFSVGEMISMLNVKNADDSYGKYPTDQYSISSGDPNSISFTMTITDDRGSYQGMGQILPEYDVINIQPIGLTLYDDNFKEGVYSWLSLLQGNRATSGTAYSLGILGTPNMKLGVLVNAVIEKKFSLRIFANDVMDVSSGTVDCQIEYVYGDKSLKDTLKMSMTTSVDGGLKSVYYQSNIRVLERKTIQFIVDPIPGVQMNALYTSISQYQATPEGAFELYNLALEISQGNLHLNTCTDDYPYISDLKNYHIYNVSDPKSVKLDTAQSLFTIKSDNVNFAKSYYTGYIGQFPLQMKTSTIKPKLAKLRISKGVQVWGWDPIPGNASATLKTNGVVFLRHGTQTDKMELTSVTMKDVQELVYPSGFSNTIDVVDLFSKINNELQLLLQCNYVILRWLVDITGYIHDLENQIERMYNIILALTKESHSTNWLTIIGGVLNLVGDVLSTFLPFVGTVFMALGAFSNALGQLTNNDVMGFLSDFFVGLFVVGVGIWKYTGLSTYMANKYKNIRKLDDNASIFSEGGSTVSTYLDDNASILVDFDNSISPYDFTKDWNYDKFDSNQLMGVMNITVHTDYSTSDALVLKTTRNLTNANKIKWRLRSNEKVVKMKSTYSRAFYINSIDVLVMYVFVIEYDVDVQDFNITSRTWWKIEKDAWVTKNENELLTDAELRSLELTIDDFTTSIKYNTEINGLFKDVSYGIGMVSFDDEYQRMQLLVAWFTRKDLTINIKLRDPLIIQKIVNMNVIIGREHNILASYYSNSLKLKQTDVPSWMRN